MRDHRHRRRRHRHRRRDVGLRGQGDLRVHRRPGASLELLEGKVRYGEIRGDMKRYGEARQGRYVEIWGEMGSLEGKVRYGEIRGDTGRCGEQVAGRTTPRTRHGEIWEDMGRDMGSLELLEARWPPGLASSLVSH